MLQARDTRSLALLALLLTACASFAAAQVRTTGEISGTVTDPSSALVANVDLKAKDLATENITAAISGDSGGFVFLNLQPGEYEISAAASGFQTVVIQRVIVETARTTDLAIRLTVGQVTETLQVADVTPVLQTTSNAVSTTIRYDYIQELPLQGRDTLQFAALQAGAQAPQSSPRNSTFNGLPNASLNITLDGINNNSNRFKSGGTSFFAFAPVRVDAVEEVNIATTGAGADAAAGGAMNIRFTTRRGTNRYHGRVFHQFSNDALNANSFFNNARGQRIAKLRQNDAGANLGGPLPIPFTKRKLYFFANFEAAPRPGTANRTADVMTQAAQQGNFSYIAMDGSVRSANVLQLASAAGFPSQIDPTVQGVFAQINGSLANGTGILPNTSNPNFATLNWRQPTESNTYYPTARLDYQISDKLAWHGSWNMRWNTTPGTPAFAGLPGRFSGSKVTTYVASLGLDWTITPSMLNSFNFGPQSSHEDFNQETDIHMWAAQGNRRLVFPAVLGTTQGQPITSQTPFIRNNPVYNFYDNLNWVKGKHVFTFGGAVLTTSFYETTWNNAGVLNYTLGVAAGDPIGSVLTQGLLGGIRTQDVGSAAALYALLTGRLSGIAGSRNVNEVTHAYENFAPITHRFGFATAGLYFQDAFRWSPQLTLNYGFRWELSGAKHNLNGITTPPDLANFYGPSTGLFHPGSLGGVADPQLTTRPYTYSGDKMNPAPNLGFAWNPRSGGSGLLGRLLNSRTVISGSYGINYYDEGINTISNLVTGNPGPTQTIALNPGAPGFDPGSLRLSGPIPAPVVNPPSFNFPIPQRLFTFLNGLSTTQPAMHTPYVQSWNFRVQREVGSGMVVEARYVGNKATHIWHNYSLNETNIFENGFLQEFKNAQRNMQINADNGVANSFQNRSLPGQVPLPIFEAAFGARGSQPALAASSGYTSNTFTTPLTLGNAGTVANTLATATNGQFFCRMVGSNFAPCAANGYNAPGPYPLNFWRPNPFVTGLTLLDDNSYSTYNGLQIEFRKAPAHGLSLNASYTWSKTLADIFNLNDQSAADNYFTLRNRNLDKSPTPFDLRHVILAYWTYELPFGTNQAWLNRIAGGWKLGGIHRVHSGQVYRLTSGRNTFNNLADSGVILNGISVGELQDMFRSFRPGPNQNAFSADPRLIAADGTANSQYLRAPTAPGEFGQIFYMYGTPLVVNDFSLEKIVRITERVRFTVQVEASNLLNHPVLDVGTTNITSNSFGQSGAAIIGPRRFEIRSRIDW